LNTELLWEEHRAAHPDGHGYSRFCEVYRTWEGRLSPTMRQCARAAGRFRCRVSKADCDARDAAIGEWW
jgi:transposase